MPTLRIQKIRKYIQYNPDSDKQIKKKNYCEKVNLGWVLNDFYSFVGFPRWLSSKESSCNVGDTGSILGSGRSPGEGNGNPFQYSCGKSHVQRSLAGYSPWGCKRVRNDLVTKQQQEFIC